MLSILSVSPAAATPLWAAEASSVVVHLTHSGGRDYCPVTNPDGDSYVVAETGPRESEEDDIRVGNRLPFPEQLPATVGIRTRARHVADSALDRLWARALLARGPPTH